MANYPFNLTDKKPFRNSALRNKKHLKITKKRLKNIYFQQKLAMQQNLENARIRTRYKNYRSDSYNKLKTNKAENEKVARKYQNILEQNFYILKKVIIT